MDMRRVLFGAFIIPLMMFAACENGKKVSYSLLAVDDKWLIWDFEDVLFNDGEVQYIRQAFERK